MVRLEMKPYNSERTQPLPNSGSQAMYHHILLTVYERAGKWNSTINDPFGAVSANNNDDASEPDAQQHASSAAYGYLTAHYPDIPWLPIPNERIRWCTLSATRPRAVEAH